MEKIARDDPQDERKFNFVVNINDCSYNVRLSQDYYQKLSQGKISPQDLIKKSFEFLLEREGPDSILKEFDLSIINRYFPEYEDEIVR